MVAALRRYVDKSRFARPFRRAFAPASRAVEEEPCKTRPNQQVIAVSELTPAERNELADLLEAEVARL